MTLVGFQSNAQTFDFSVTTEVAWDEADGFDDASNEIAVGSANGGTSLTGLNERIVDAMPTDFNTTACYVISGSAAYALEFSRQTFVTAGTDCRIDGKAVNAATRSFGQGVIAASSGELSIEVKEASTALRRTQQHIDFERGASQQLIITAYAQAAAGTVKVGDAIGSLTVNIKVANHDESPYVTQSTTARPNWYMRPGDSDTLLISQLFRDPEGVPFTLTTTMLRLTFIFAIRPTRVTEQSVLRNLSIQEDLRLLHPELPQIFNQQIQRHARYQTHHL